jgi:hypothetical protein
MATQLKFEHPHELERFGCFELEQFERYAEAVGAERYRVTCIELRADGSKQTFLLDKKNGVSLGFTREEVAQRIPEMQRFQRRGENIYYTPLSNGKHHILIDDLTREKLQRLIRDGYQPAVVLESSPGNYQAVITLPKLLTPHDRDVGNALSKMLNREYGDPKLSGAVHPHRAPGFPNRKPKYRREDGSYPLVRLLKAECRECRKSMELSREIDARYQRQAAEKSQAQQPERSAKPDPELAAASGSAINAYWMHYRDVLKRQRGGALDLSRVDSMIALRMRVTGHDLSAITGALRQCAPAIRKNHQAEGRHNNWDDYAQRTARYAYSPAGNLQAERLAKYRQQWERLEGREPQRQQAKARAEHF